MNNGELVSDLMPYLLALIGIVFVAYAVNEPRYDKKTGAILECGKNETVVYLYLTFAVICFIIFGWMIHS